MFHEGDRVVITNPVIGSLDGYTGLVEMTRDSYTPYGVRLDANGELWFFSEDELSRGNGSYIY
jgi:hypothetical protein